MSGPETERPVLQVIGDQDAASCDPITGVCELPDASETPDPVEPAEARGPRSPLPPHAG